MKEAFRCNVKGHFVYERQCVLRDLFKKNIKEEDERLEKETLIDGLRCNYATVVKNIVYLIEEPDNPNDPNAIGIYVMDNGEFVLIGYVPKYMTGYMRRNVNFGNKYNSKLYLYQGVDREDFIFDPYEVMADVIIYQ